MTELELLQAVVIAQLTRGVGDLAAAPLKGVADDLQRRVREAMGRIGQNAAHKANGQPIEAPERVLHKALLEGAFAEDEVVADYIGGVLAASDSSDAAAPIIAQIGRLSSAQLRLHFVVFREIRRLLVGTREIGFYDSSRALAEISVDASELMIATGLDWNGTGSGLAVLTREGLVTTYTLSAATGIASITPTGLGAELFLWGNGLRQTDAHLLLDPTLDVRFTTDVPATPSATLTRSTPAETSG